MKRSLFLMAIVLMALTLPSFAKDGRNFYEGFNLRFSATHIPVFHTVIFGDVYRENMAGIAEDQTFAPNNDIGLSLSAEYLLPIDTHIEIGLGFEYNFKNTFDRYYHNNGLIRRGSRQNEQYREFSSYIPYIVLKYTFATANAMRPYLFGHFGYSFNEIGGYSLMMYEEGPVDSATGMPGFDEGEDVTYASEVRYLKNSVYYQLGFGLTIRNHYFLELGYSHTCLNFRVEYPMLFEDQYGEHDISVKEIHTANLDKVHLNLGFSFAASPLSPNTARPQKAERWLLSGLDIRLGVNNNLTHHGHWDHTASTLNELGEYIGSIRNFSFDPVELFTPTVGIQYVYPIVGALEIGAGVEYNFKRTYMKSKTVVDAASAEYDTPISGDIVTVDMRDFSNTVAYFACKYNFISDDFIRPYAIGRIGYSFNDVDYVTTRADSVLDTGTPYDIVNSLYFGVGFGAKLTNHFAVEAIYTQAYSGFKTTYYEDVFDKTHWIDMTTKDRNIHLNLVYNL